MTTLTSKLTELRRPRLLIRAARYGVAEYDRTSSLHRLIDAEHRQDENTILTALLSAEAESEKQRRDGHATYSVTRHIDLLVALMGEARRHASFDRAA